MYTVAFVRQLPYVLAADDLRAIAMLHRSRVMALRLGLNDSSPSDCSLGPPLSRLR